MSPHPHRKGGIAPLVEHEEALMRGLREAQTVAPVQRERRERIATAALQGLLASTPLAAQPASNADAMASRAVRYADALLDALNRTTTEALHARHR